jgi:serine/threonine protein kinase
MSAARQSGDCGVDVLTPEDPRQVGRYRLLARLGSGGMGQVFLGQSPGGRLVAVKLIRPELACNPEFRARFAREVAAARMVSGIFTAPVVDADPDCPQPWLVTAYVDGTSLAEAVAADGPLPAISVLTLAAGLAEGLDAIHAAGVVHRDLKPENVMLASDGPRIIDFGISRAQDAKALTRAGWVPGSPGFMSPEQAEGQPAGPPSDIFSLGAVLVFAATGRGPFGSGAPTVLLRRVVCGKPNLGGVPAPARDLIERCLASDPLLRPTAGQILAERGLHLPAAPWQQLDERPRSVRSRHGPPYSGALPPYSAALPPAAPWPASVRVPGRWPSDLLAQRPAGAPVLVADPPPGCAPTQPDPPSPA